MANWFGKTFDRFGGVLGAFSFSQIPMYIQSYFLQLYGHLAELQYQIDKMKTAAAQNGKTLNEFIQKFINSSDPDYKIEGQVMQAMVERSDTLADNLYALQTASIWEQPIVFLNTVDWNIAQATFDNYQVGLPLNADGGLFAGLGLVVGYSLLYIIRFIFWLITYPFIKIFGRKKTNETEAKH